MLRTQAPGVSLWEAVLPEEVLRLPAELARVDALLDDPAFFAGFAPFFDPRPGRPSTPMEVYLRLMFLKFRYRLGYESLCREVGDSITWRRFCRIGLDGRVPHPTTLMKLTTRCGPAAIDACNEALPAKAAAAKLLRTSRLRADHGRARGCRLSDRFGAAGQGGNADRRDRAADPGRGRCGAHPTARSFPRGRDPGPGDRSQVAAAHCGRARRGPGCGAADHR
jgi:IS5 family transposase